MESKRVLVLDVETTKKPTMFPWMKGASLCSVGVIDSKDRFKYWLFDYRGPTEKNYVYDDTILEAIKVQEIQQLIDAHDVLVGHNIKFDALWLRGLGINVDNIEFYDTMVADYMINGQLKIGYALNECLTRYRLPLKRDEMATYWDAGEETYNIPLSVHVPYLEQDCRTEKALYTEQQKFIKTLKLEKITKLCCEVTKILSRMEFDGCLFDEQKAKETVIEYTSLVEQHKNKLKEIAGFDFNPASNDQLSVVLFGGQIKETVKVPKEGPDGVCVYKSGPRKGEVCYKNTLVTSEHKGLGFFPPDDAVSKKSGVFKTNTNILSGLEAVTEEQKEFLESLSNMKKAAKIIQTFYSSKDEEKGLLNKVGTDGCIHPHFNQVVTATARLSSSEPNGQNLHTPIKRTIIPRLGRILNGDAAQIEFRIAAELSRDPVMLDEIKHGIDVHADNAIRFFDAGKFDRESKEFKKLRKIAKFFLFRLLYGGSAGGFAKDKKMPPYSKREWEGIIKAFYTKYARLKEWQDECIDFVNKNGFLRTPSGRLLEFVRSTEPGRNYGKYDVRKIKNYPVQSASADLLYVAMVETFRRLAKLGIKPHLILVVHDSLVFDCREEDVDILGKTVKMVFKELPTLAKQYLDWDMVVVMDGDVEVGEANYGDVTSIHYDEHEFESYE